MFSSLCFITNFSKAQTITKEFYYDYYWRPVKTKVEARYYGVAIKTDSGWHKQNVYLPEGKIEMDGFYEDDSLSIATGKCMHFYPNGNLESIGEFWHGNKIGKWSAQYEDKNLKYVAVYDSLGRLSSNFISFYPNGNLKDSITPLVQGTSVCVSWFISGNVDSVGRLNASNQKINTWKYYREDGSLSSKEKYDAGALVNKEYFDSTGKSVDTLDNTRSATYAGGVKDWTKYLVHHLSFPANYRITNSDTAQTIVAFLINTKGEASDYKVVHPFAEVFDESVLKTLRSNKKNWQPARNHNRFVEEKVTQKVKFIQN